MFNWIEIFKDFPPELATLLIAMIPIAELRAALPIALGAYHLPLVEAFLLCMVGNMLPVLFILWWIEPVSRWLRRWKIFDNFFNWLFARTRRKFYNAHQKWGNVGLMIFVGIPLPLTGAWSGALAAWLFGIKYKIALFYITLGVIIAGVIVSLISLGVITIFD